MTIASTTLPTFPFWPNNQPFHAGELQLQEKFGVMDHVAQFAPKFIRPFMPDQHREFYIAQPFLLVSARDSRGKMWATILANGGETDFVTSPDPFSLSIDANPLPGDALLGAFQEGDDMGIVGIEFEAKRRNRVNGRVRRRSIRGSIDFEVGQSFGNCPQYIRPRQWWKKTSTDTCPEGEAPIQRSHELTTSQMDQIKKSDTLFVASGYRGGGESASYGNDISHRGGPKGWIKVKDSNTLVLPDFPGNDMYNTLGNVVMDSRFGVTVPIFESGGMIQMSGRAEIDYDQGRADALFPGALRLLVFTIEEVVTVDDGSLPLTWKVNEDESSRKVEVVHKIKQSTDITSFYLRPVEGDDPELWDFKPGQHLPIVLNLGDDKIITRTYSLSDVPNTFEYRISVKRKPFGQASRFLHDKIEEGDIIEVNKPAGDYFVNETSDRDLVLVSAGVGVTPVLSMLHKFANTYSKKRSTVWVHGARDGDHHPFHGEVKGLQEAYPDSISSHVVYSRPRSGDKGMYDSTGRLTPELLANLVPDLYNADFYMCGPAAFMADIESGLQELGVAPNYISYETF